LARIEKEAEQCGADHVVGVKTRVYDLGGGLVEFMAIGTAVKKIPGVTTTQPHLPPQAIIQDRETFIDSTDGISTGLSRGSNAAPAIRTQRGPLGLIGIIFVILIYLLKIFAHTHH
jgi:hypothetical protein